MNDKITLRIIIYALIIGTVNQYSSFQNALLCSLGLIIMYLILIFHNNLISIQFMDNHLKSITEVLKKITDKSTN